MKFNHDAVGRMHPIPEAQRPPQRERDIYADPTFADTRRVGALADQIGVPAIRFDPIIQEWEWLGGPDILNLNSERKAA